MPCCRVVAAPQEPAHVGDLALATNQRAGRRRQRERWLESRRRAGDGDRAGKWLGAGGRGNQRRTVSRRQVERGREHRERIWTGRAAPATLQRTNRVDTETGSLRQGLL